MTTQVAGGKALLAEFAGKRRELWEKLSIKPWPGQAPPLESWSRWCAIFGGEQVGKSLMASLKAIAWHWVAQLLEERNDRLYWFVGQTYADTKAEFQFVARFCQEIYGVDKVKVSGDFAPGSIVLPDGAVWETKSADDPRQLASFAPDGIIECEPGRLTQEAHSKCILRVTAAKNRKNTGWLILAGTYEGSVGWYPVLGDEWKHKPGCASFNVPSWENRTVYPGGRNDPLILQMERDLPEDLFMERIAAVPRPPKGRVFNDFHEDIHVSSLATFDPNYPVTIAVDPGTQHAYAVLALQVVQEQARVIAEVYKRNLDTEEVINITIDPMRNPWWRNIHGGVIDVSGTYRQGAMTPVAQLWFNMAHVALTGQLVHEEDGREQIHRFLKVDPIRKVPRLIVNPSCTGLLSEMGVCLDPFDHQVRPYRWKVDTDGTVVGEHPIDANNHSIKALAYWLVDRFGFSDGMSGKRRRDRQLVRYA